MKTVHVQGYGATVNFPDDTPDNTIESVLKENFPETDEMLVARFDNPDTPASGLSREDFSRYKRVKPPTALSDLPGIVVDAASMTAGLIARGLPEAVKTYGNIFDPGTAARTFMEGAARGAYDTETLGKMANNYLRSKVESFGGTSENEEDDQYKRFLALKELQNVRSAIERGDRSAWNEYAEFAGVEGMKIDESRINTAAAELTGEAIDLSTLIPGTKIGAMAAKGATRALSTPVRGLGKGLSRAADATRKGQDWATSKIRGFEEAIDEGTGGLGKVVIPGGIGAAAASGVIGGGAATFGAGAIAAPTIMDLAGGLLTGFGEAMAHTPTRLGGLGRLASNMPDTVAGKLAGRIKWMDRPAEYAGRAAAGAGVGAGVGAGIGLVSGGLEGMAQGIGSGGVLGAAGGGFARTVEGLTGSNLRKAQDSDFDRWVSKKDPDDRKRLSAIKDRRDRMIRMDAEEILLGAGAEVRHVGPDHEVNGRKLGKAQGYHDIEGGKNIVYLNTNADAGTMSHEVYHALARLDGFDMMNSSIKQLHQRLHSPEEINKFIQTYEKRLKNRIPLSEGQLQKMGNSTEAKVDYILEELGAEYFRNTIEGKNSDYIFSGNSFAESLKGIFARFTKGKLDRVYDTFTSPILGEVKKTRLMDRMMADLVKARRKAARDVEMSIDEPVRVYAETDLADDSKFREMEGMGIAKVDRKGKRVLMGKTEQDRVAAERAASVAGVLDKVPGETGGMAKQPDGSYKGTRFSAGQLQALMDSPLINDTIKKAIREIQAIADGDQYANWTYAAALMKTKKGLNRYRNLPVSNRDAMLYDLVVSPKAGTITGRMLDMSMTESRARRLYNQSGEMQKLFGSEAQLFSDLHDYINALTSGERRTAEVLGSQRKSDFLSKILAVRNVKGNPEIPDPASMSRTERRRAEGESNHPWRSFRLDRIVAMKQKQGRPVLSFSEPAYQRGQAHFSPEPVRPVEQHPENQPIQGRLTGEQKARIKELQDHYEEKTPERMRMLKADAIASLSSRLMNLGIPVIEAKSLARDTFRNVHGKVKGAVQVVSGMGKSDLSRLAGAGRPSVKTRDRVNPNWLTSAFESFENDIDLAMMKAQQVGGAESGVRQVTPDQGQAFVTGERLADTKAFGSSLRDDAASPPRVYSSVIEGQKFGSQGNYNLFFEWDKKTPMVATSHHHYGVANGVTDIHASANVGDKNARSFGDPGSESYDTLPSGKQVLDTPLLVGNKGIPTARAHQLMVSTPSSGLNEVKRAYKKGGIGAARTELAKVVSSELVGKQSQGKAKSYASPEGVPMTVAIQRNRTEAYVLNPDLANVKRVTIVSNNPDEVRVLKNNLRDAFKNNSSKTPPIKVVSRDSGPSGNRGRKAITDEHYKLTGETRFSPARPTHRRMSDKLSGQDVVLFADDPQSNAHYGKHIWELSQDLPEVTGEVVQFAADYYGVDMDQARSLVDPDNIVDNAAAWDDRQFVSDLWQAYEEGQIKTPPAGFKTQDGAVVLDRESVQMDYTFDSDDIRFSPSRTLSADEITAWAKSHTPSEIGEKLDSMKLTSTNNMLKLMGDFPEYLNPVIDYVVEKRQQLINGQISPRDVAKAYFITASSIGADAINVSKIKETTDRLGVDFNPDPMFLSRGAKGQLKMRPEEMAAWWLGTESGQRALNAIESGVIDRDAWEVGMAIRDAYGRQDFRTRQAGTPYTNSKGESKLTTYRAGGTGDLTNQKEFNLTNIIPLTEAINKTKGNPRKLEKVLTEIKGVGEGKKGFIGHLIGMGSSPTIDAVELNIWLTGRGSTTRASESMKKRTALAKNAGGKQQQKLYDRITKRIKQLRKSVPEGSKIPVDVAPHILHHWIWDAGKGLETTHEGVYHAMIHFSPQRTLNNRGGAIYTTEQGHKAIQTSSRAGVRVYDSAGKRIGPVFASVERAERYLRK